MRYTLYEGRNVLGHFDSAEEALKVFEELSKGSQEMKESMTLFDREPPPELPDPSSE